MNFSEAPEFKKDVKRLSKKWRSIPDDIEAAKVHILPLYVSLDKNVSIENYRQAFFNNKKATILQSSDGFEVVKIRLDVESLGSNNKVRLVFTAIQSDNSILFVELYAKNEKPREDNRRIKKYLS